VAYGRDVFLLKTREHQEGFVPDGILYPRVFRAAGHSSDHP
jgi:hypothetical protein